MPSNTPTDTAATKSRIGEAAICCCVNMKPIASCNAMNAPVMPAVRVPPSAWITSQSMWMVRSPIFSRSTTERSARPMSRWISCVRPDCLPRAASRSVRVPVERGSMPYSAVIQPCVSPFKCGGCWSSTLAVQITRVSPHSISTEPSACRV